MVVTGRRRRPPWLWALVATAVLAVGLGGALAARHVLGGRGRGGGSSADSSPPHAATGTVARADVLGTGASTTPPVTVVGTTDGRPPADPDEIAARVCGRAALQAGPPSAAAAKDLFPDRTIVEVPAGANGDVVTGDAGTVYWLAPGEHRLEATKFAQIVPKDGDTFIGAPGAVLDGKQVNRYAFAGSATGVTIRYLTVQGFVPPMNEGVVNHDSANGWTIEHTTITRNSGAGMMVGANQVVRSNCLADNGQYGFNAYQGGDGISDLVLEHNEIKGNNTEDWEKRQPGCGCTGGGKFWAVKGAKVTENWVHDNRSVGLWADTNNVDFLFQRNIVENNDDVGIWYEISYNARIVDNLLSRNGWSGGKADTGAPSPAIYLSESGGDARLPTKYSRAPLVEIAGNRVVDNYSGITLYENANRFCNSNGNSSASYCTPFVTGGTIPEPWDYTYGKPVNADHPCNAPGIDTEPLFTDCRWRTQHVAIHDNDFSFDDKVVPCGSEYCGVMALYVSGADNQSWQPYVVADVVKALTTNQDNRWTNNRYTGRWHFAVGYGDRTDWGTWQSKYDQDQGSSAN